MRAWQHVAGMSLRWGAELRQKRRTMAKHSSLIFYNVSSALHNGNVYRLSIIL